MFSSNNIEKRDNYVHDYIHDYTGDDIDMLIDGIRILSEEGDIKNCNIVKIKLANIYLSNEEYSKAIALYDVVIDTTEINLENKANIEIYIFNSMICKFLLKFSYQSINKDLNKYTNYIITFEFSDKFKFLTTINICLAAGDVDGFTKALNEYEATNNIDILTKSQLNKIKNLITMNRVTGNDFVWQNRYNELEEINIRLAKEIIDLNESLTRNRSSEIKIPDIDIFANLIADKIIKKISNNT